MIKRYRAWMEANPLGDWLLSVTIALSIMLTGFFVVSGPKKPGFAMLLVCIALSSPTCALWRRFEDEGRPVPPKQEVGVGLVALLSSLCGISAFSVCLLENRFKLPPDGAVTALFVFSVSTLLSLALGYPARKTWAGRWALRLTLGWLLFISSVAIVTALGRAA